MDNVSRKQKSGKPAKKRQGHKATPENIERLDLVKEAVELRLRGLEFHDIAKRQGCVVATAYRRVQAGMRDTLETTKPMADQLRAEHNARLGRYLEALHDSATQGDVQAIDRAVKILERLSRLNGLDAPAKSEVMHEGRLDISALAAEYRKQIRTMTDAELDEEAMKLGVGAAITE